MVEEYKIKLRDGVQLGKRYGGMTFLSYMQFEGLSLARLEERCGKTVIFSRMDGGRKIYYTDTMLLVYRMCTPEPKNKENKGE